jgi:hypothetical protein
MTLGPSRPQSFPHWGDTQAPQGHWGKKLLWRTVRSPGQTKVVEFSSELGALPCSLTLRVVAAMTGGEDVTRNSGADNANDGNS